MGPILIWYFCCLIGLKMADFLKIFPSNNQDYNFKELDFWQIENSFVWSSFQAWLFFQIKFRKQEDDFYWTDFSFSWFLYQHQAVIYLCFGYCFAIFNLNSCFLHSCLIQYPIIPLKRISSCWVYFYSKGIRISSHLKEFFLLCSSENLKNHVFSEDFS